MAELLQHINATDVLAIAMDHPGIASAVGLLCLLVWFALGCAGLLRFPGIHWLWDRIDGWTAAVRERRRRDREYNPHQKWSPNSPDAGSEQKER